MSSLTWGTVSPDPVSPQLPARVKAPPSSRSGFRTCAPEVLLAAPPSCSAAPDYPISVHLAFEAFTPPVPWALLGASPRQGGGQFSPVAPQAGPALLRLPIERGAARAPSPRPLSSTTSADTPRSAWSPGPSLWLTPMVPVLSLDLSAAIHTADHASPLSRPPSSACLSPDPSGCLFLVTDPLTGLSLCSPLRWEVPGSSSSSAYPHLSHPTYVFIGGQLSLLSPDSMDISTWMSEGLQLGLLKQVHQFPLKLVPCATPDT